MPDLRKFGNTSNLVRFKLTKSADGTAYTGLSSASSGLVISTIADNEATPTAYTAAGSTIETITTLGTFATPTATKCRFKEVDATNHPGLYEFQIADARYAVTSARRMVISVSGVSGLFACDYEIELVQADLFDAVRLGLTALPNAAAEAAGGLYTRGTGAGQINQDANGRADMNIKAAAGTTVTLDANNVLNVSTKYVGGTLQTARDLGLSVLLSVGTGTGQVNLSGGKAPATIAAGDLAADSVTASALATDAVQEIRNAITGGAYAFSTDANGRVRVVDGTSAGELDTNAGLVTLTAAAVQSIWDALTSALTTSGSIGKRLADDIDATISSRLASGSYTTPPTAAANASAVWEELTSGHSTAGSFGKLAVDNINATISSRSSHSAADVWAVATRVLTAGTNIALAKGVGVTGFNDIAAADVWAFGTRTLSALGFTLGASDLATGILTAAKFAADAIDAAALATGAVQEIRNAITGYAGPLDTDANGAIRIVDGTGTRELDTASGLVKISGTIQTLDSLNTSQNTQHSTTQAAIAALNNLSQANIRTAIGLSSANLDIQLDALPTNAELATALGTADDAVLAAIAALSIPTVSQITRTQMAESYAANGVLPTLEQAIMAIHQKLMASEYDGTVSRTYKFNNTDVAFEGELDDATDPTSDRRAA